MVLANNAGIILSIFAFYIALTAIFGLVGSSQLQSTSIGAPPTTPGLSSLSYFFSGIGYTISSIPAVFNLLLFAPLGITIAYIALEVIATAIP